MPSKEYEPAGQGGRSPLTPRQAEVVKFARDGMSAKEIARAMGISKRTVEEHLDNARQRTGAVSRNALVALTGRPKPSGAGQPLSGTRNPSEHQAPAARASGAAAPKRGGRPRTMTADMIRAARELVETCSMAEIARKLGVGRTTLYNHMKEIKSGLN
jgi:DNA-binding CsgD family transcriptional regulator